MHISPTDSHDSMYTSSRQAVTLSIFLDVFLMDKLPKDESAR